VRGGRSQRTACDLRLTQAWIELHLRAAVDLRTCDELVSTLWWESKHSAPLGADQDPSGTDCLDMMDVELSVLSHYYSVFHFGVSTTFSPRRHLASVYSLLCQKCSH
jgi:hypothetical protein